MYATIAFDQTLGSNGLETIEMANGHYHTRYHSEHSGGSVADRCFATTVSEGCGPGTITDCEIDRERGFITFREQNG